MTNPEEVNSRLEQTQPDPEAGLLAKELAQTSKWISLEELTLAAFRKDNWDKLGLWLLLGSTAASKDNPKISWGEGIWQALQSLGRWEVSGSQVTRAILGPERVTGSRSNSSKILEALQPLTNRPAIRDKEVTADWGEQLPEPNESLADCYYDNGLDLAKMEPYTYLAFHFFLNLQGSNFDYKLYCDENNFDTTLIKILAITRMMYTHAVGGGRRKIIVSSFDGKFLNLSFFDTTAAGMLNIGVFSADKPNRWTTATNWRAATSLPVIENAAGQLGVDVPLQPFTEPLKLLLTPQSLAEWKLHLARSLRIITTHTLSAEAIDLKSFSEKKPPTDDGWTFFSALSTTCNLLIAFFENPSLTLESLQTVGWFGAEDAPKLALLSKVQTLLDSFPTNSAAMQPQLLAVLREFSQNQPEVAKLTQAFATAEQNLFKPTDSQPQPASQQFFTFPDLASVAPLFYALCPISLNDLEAVIPPPADRESLTVYVAGEPATDATNPAQQSIDSLGLRRTETTTRAAEELWTIAGDIKRRAERAYYNSALELAQRLFDAAKKVRDESLAIFAHGLPAEDEKKRQKIRNARKW